MNADMFMVTICQEFGWDYYTYMNQPSFFIQIVKEKLIRDNKESEMKMRNNSRKK